MRRGAVTLLVLVQLAGCSVAPLPHPETPPAANCTRVVHTDSQLVHWLAEIDAVAALSPEQAQEQLSEQVGRGDTSWQKYRYALLNQRLGDNAGWIRARDTLRDLRDSGALDSARVQLAQVLLDYSQAMINASARQRQLATELADAQRQQQALAAKIEALTHLEKNISERKNHGEGKTDDSQ